MHGEILFNRKEYKQALADYKQLQTRATTAERRQLGVTGVLRCGVLLKDDIEVIQAATALLAEAKLTPELQNEALYYRAKAYLNQKAVKRRQTTSSFWQRYPYIIRCGSQVSVGTVDVQCR